MLNDTLWFYGPRSITGISLVSFFFNGFFFCFRRDVLFLCVEYERCDDILSSATDLKTQKALCSQGRVNSALRF